MVCRKRWVGGEVDQSRSLVDCHSSVDEIAFMLNKTLGTVIVKCHWLGLPVQAKGYMG